MKQIGFKNFRRFEDFPTIDLGEITFLVGKNNSGKSTLVKAILLIIDYFKNQKIGTFAFDGKVLNDANVVSFKRTLHNRAKEDIISFNFTIRNFNCEITITGNENDTKAKVNSLKLTALKDGLEVDINLTGTPVIRIRREYSVVFVNDEILTQALDRLKELEEELASIPDDDIIEFIYTSGAIEAQKKRIAEYKKVNQKKFNSYEIAYQLPSAENYSLSEIIYDVIRLNREAKKNNKKTDDLVNIQSLEADEKLIIDKIDIFSNYLSKLDLSYFGADSHKQSALLSIKENNNTLTQAIHNYYQLRIQGGTEEYSFVKTWMDKFEIGQDFSLECIEGEVYKLDVFEDDEEKQYPINIADKGMGSLQSMKLIFEVIPAIHQYNKDIANGKQPKNSTLIIEEPELNIHPKLQSILAEFFYFINKKYKIRLIIETHSEYIIRKAQTIALSENLINIDNPELDSNPFNIYYFHAEEGPYPMIFTKEGRFHRNFGEGFFDEATNSTKKLLKLNLLKK